MLARFTVGPALPTGRRPTDGHASCPLNVHMNEYRRMPRTCTGRPRCGDAGTCFALSPSSFIFQTRGTENLEHRDALVVVGDPAVQRHLVGLLETRKLRY